MKRNILSAISARKWKYNSNPPYPSLARSLALSSRLQSTEIGNWISSSSMKYGRWSWLFAFRQIVRFDDEARPTVFFLFFFLPPPEALARIRGRRSSTTRRASLSLSLDSEQHRPARKSGCSCLRIWKIFFARSIRLRVEGHPARRVRDNKDTSNTWRWRTSIWKKSGGRTKGSEKLIKGIRVARRGGRIDDASLSFSPLDDDTFHGMITITNVAWLSKQTFIKARRIVARVARLWFEKTRRSRREARYRDD